MVWCTAHYSSRLTQAVDLPPFCDMKLNICVMTSRLISGHHSNGKPDQLPPLCLMTRYLPLRADCPIRLCSYVSEGKGQPYTCALIVRMRGLTGSFRRDDPWSIHAHPSEAS